MGVAAHYGQNPMKGLIPVVYDLTPGQADHRESLRSGICVTPSILLKRGFGFPTELWVVELPTVSFKYQSAADEEVHPPDPW